MELGGFDKIASMYDGLARLVFGESIRQAQTCFLNDIPPQSKVLILGGGSGWLLTQLLRLKPECEIWYIEASEKMIELAKATVNSNHIHFIYGTEDSIPTLIQFDVVITAFYLDLFTEKSLGVVVKKIQNKVKPDGIWLVTDFVGNKKWWQNILLGMMYRFFRVLCGIEAVGLPNWNQSLVSQDLVKRKSRFFYRAFIESTVYTSH